MREHPMVLGGGREGRPVVAALLGASLLCAAFALPVARAELDDPEFHQAMILLQGGDSAGAVAALGEPLARRAGELYVLQSDPSADAERVHTLERELGTLHRYLAIAEHATGHGEQALHHLRQLLVLEPDARLDPLEAPRALMLKLDELKDARTQATDSPRTELAAGPVQGIEHVLPLVVVKGSEVTLYVRFTDDADVRISVDHCAGGDARGGCDSPRRTPLARVRDGVYAATLSAALASDSAQIRYRIGAVDGTGRTRSTPWYSLTVIANLPGHVEREGNRYGPRAQELLRAGSVDVRLAPAAPLPSGVREVDARGSELEVHRRAY